MSITINNALSILGITDENVNPQIVKQAYRKAAKEYHPDHNPAGLEMMKLVNLAYELLKNFTGSGNSSTENRNYGEIINTALNAVIDLDLIIEVCGMWVWVSGDTKKHKETLKSAGYLWAPKKKNWYFRPDNQKSYRRMNSLPMAAIRAKYGSEVITSSKTKRYLN